MYKMNLEYLIHKAKNLVTKILPKRLRRQFEEALID